MTVDFPLSFMRNVRLRGLLTKEIENGREGISIGCKTAAPEDY